MELYDDSLYLYSSKAWKQKIQFELNGADYQNTMRTKTIEGITLEPFYHIDNLKKSLPKIAVKPTTSVKQITITTEKEANILANQYVDEGDTSICFITNTPFDYQVLFKNLLRKNIIFHLKMTFFSEIFITSLYDFLVSETLYYNIDYIGKLAHTGNPYTSLKEDVATVKKLITKTPKKHTLIGVNAQHYQHAGANAIQQIAYALSHAHEYMILFGKSLPSITFHFAIGSHYFMEIAKIISFKQLWNILQKEYAIQTEAIIIAQPSERQLSFLPKLNTLRIASAQNIALTSGVDYFMTQDKITSSQLSADAYLINALVLQMVEKAFDLFKTIEKGNGFLQQLKKGTIQQKIKENSEKEIAIIKNKTSSLPIEKVKVNQYKRPIKTIIEPIINRPISI